MILSFVSILLALFSSYCSFLLALVMAILDQSSDDVSSGAFGPNGFFIVPQAAFMMNAWHMHPTWRSKLRRAGSGFCVPPKLGLPPTPRKRNTGLITSAQ